MLRVTSRILAVAVAIVCTVFAAGGPQVAAAGPSGYLAPMSAGFMRDVYTLPTDRQYGAFVRFNKGTAADHRLQLSAAGLRVVGDYERHAKAVYAIGPIGGFRSLVNNVDVAYLEDNQRLHYDMNTAPWASRVRVAQEPVGGGPYKDASGRILRGQGTTIVVVDSGLNAAHPDFAGRVVHNYKVVCSTPGLGNSTTDTCFGPYQIIDVGQTDSDTTGGHGTHCMGIAAGSGAASTGDYSVAGAAPNVKGTHTGVAPDAKLIAYGAGEEIHMYFVVEAYSHLLDNWDPSIKVVSNSYGSTGAYDPNSIAMILANQVVARGANVVFSAGNGDTLNDGGTGADDRTRSQCKNPTPGIICVANYDDAGTGSRTGELDFSSSRGLKGDPANYPDIAAPGASITATCTQPQPGQAVCATGIETTWQPYYGTISGTSMSTPHVAGAVALLAQADPTLTPAQIEALIQNTALKVTSNGPYEADPQNVGGTTNFGMGAGLLDLPGALNAIGTAHGGTPASGVEVTIFDGYTNAAVAGAANITKLTMQEATVGVNSTGIRYRLSFSDAANFTTAPNGLVYVLKQNVDGKHFETRLTAGPGGVVPVSEGGSGVASSASRSGNVVSFFVPYLQLGSPTIGSPIHNISVSVLDGATGAPLNSAPHPANGGGASEALQPMYGKPFSVQLPAGSGPTENACLVPGLTIAAEGINDNLPPTPGTDLRSLNVAEPYAADAASTKLVFTLNTDPGRALQPIGEGWYVSFVNGRDHKVYGARMVFRSGSPSFESYQASGSLNTSDPNAEGQTDGRFADTFRPADPNSNYDHLSGKITIIVPMADVGLQPGDAITGFNAASTLTTNPEELPIPYGTQIIDGMPDLLGYVGRFDTYVAAASCPVSASPVPRLTPTSLNFGSQKVATKSGSQTVIYTNTWTKPLPVNAISMQSQDSAGEFVQTNDCPKSLPVGASCRISVQFRPLQAGARSGTMSIIANNGRRTDTVKLSGAGVQ